MSILGPNAKKRTKNDFDSDDESSGSESSLSIGFLAFAHIEETYTHDLGGSATEQRKRAKKVWGSIELREGNRDPGQLHPICCKRASDGKYEDTPAPFAAAGHLVASILGGPNDDWNLVPVSNEFNLSQMKASVEDEIVRTLKDEGLASGTGTPPDASLEVEVLEYYDGTNGQWNFIPKRVRYTFKYQKVRPTGKMITKSSGTKRTTVSQVQVPELVESTETVISNISQAYLQVTAIPYDNKLGQFLAALERQMVAEKWFVEDVPAMAAFKNSVPGDRTIPRPYAVLDYWLIEKEGGIYNDQVLPPDLNCELSERYEPLVSITGKGGRRAEFETWQEQLILKVHAAWHTGYFESDAFGRAALPNTGVPVTETHQRLILGAAGSGPSFDHILPATLGGSNLFSNCQLTSIKFNSSKGNKF
jgi:hypothetical protein